MLEAQLQIPSLSMAWEEGSDVDGNSKGRAEGVLGVQRGSANRIIQPMPGFSSPTSHEGWGGSSAMVPAEPQCHFPQSSEDNARSPLR